MWKFIRHIHFDLSTGEVDYVPGDWFSNPQLPNIKNVQLGRGQFTPKPPMGVIVEGVHNGYLDQPLTITLDAPAPANCYLRLWRYSKRSGRGAGQSIDDRRVKAAFRGIRIITPPRGFLFMPMYNQPIPVGATQFELPYTVRNMYAPTHVRGTGRIYKPGNKYCDIGRNFSFGNAGKTNRVLYKFSTTIWDGTRHIMGINDGNGAISRFNSLIARVKENGM